MWHVKKFSDNAQYFSYLHSDDVWLPRLSYILNNHVENINPATGRDANEGNNDWSTSADSTRGLRLGGDNRRWIDVIDLGTHFIELANNTLYFKDIYSPQGWYRAAVSDGVLNITTPNGKATFDDTTGVLNFYNYPNDVYSIGGVV